MKSGNRNQIPARECKEDIPSMSRTTASRGEFLAVSAAFDHPSCTPATSTRSSSVWVRLCGLHTVHAQKTTYSKENVGMKKSLYTSMAVMIFHGTD